MLWFGYFSLGRSLVFLPAVGYEIGEHVDQSEQMAEAPLPRGQA